MATVGTAAVCTATHGAAATAVLLSRLATDDVFRAELEARPGAARLPAKEELAALLADAVRRGVFRDPAAAAPFTHRC